MTAYPAAVPAPRGEHSSCVCCADVRADLADAALDMFDAWMVGGVTWVEMTRQQPPHPSMRRLLDCCATVEHRHHRGSGDGETTALNADPWAAGAGGGQPPLPVRVDL